eukprot:m.118951 g.118951  ORF g.118951 m.118951 type:complete len:120 (-) comp16448_c0_seq2:1828-2187(-)
MMSSAAAVVLAVVVAVATAAAPKKLNILFIVSDDLCVAVCLDVILFVFSLLLLGTFVCLYFALSTFAAALLHPIRGYADLGYTGSSIKTPHIDGLANNGTVLGHCALLTVRFPSTSMPT